MLLNITQNCVVNMEPGLVYKSEVNEQFYTSIEPYHILRYLPEKDKWIIVENDEVIKNLSNYSYHEYSSDNSDDYVKCSYEEAYSIYMNGFGSSYIKIEDHYLDFVPISNLMDSNQLESLSFYKENHSRPFNDISGYKEFNGQYIFSQPYTDDDIYF